MKRVLFIGRNDWANGSHRAARAINEFSGSQIARVMVQQPHPFHYEEDIVVGDRIPRGFARMAVEYSRGGILVGTGDGPKARAFFHNMVSTLGTWVRGVAVRHPGSAFRSDKKRAQLDDMDRANGVSVRMLAPDLFRLAVNEVYFKEDETMVHHPYLHAHAPVVPHEPDPCGDKPRIAHIPSNYGKKGSDVIVPVLREFASRAEIDLGPGRVVRHRRALRRRAHAEIYVDQMEETIGGFGASAIEAMAQGCAVIASMHHVAPAVWEYWPRPPIIEARTADDLRAALERLLSDRDYLDTVRAESVEWSRRHTSNAAVGAHWVKCLELQ